LIVITPILAVQTQSHITAEAGLIIIPESVIEPLVISVTGLLHGLYVFLWIDGKKLRVILISRIEVVKIYYFCKCLVNR
jgi:hypothetical protein